MHSDADGSSSRWRSSPLVATTALAIMVFGYMRLPDDAGRRAVQGDR